MTKPIIVARLNRAKYQIYTHKNTIIDEIAEPCIDVFHSYSNKILIDHKTRIALDMIYSNLLFLDSKLVEWTSEAKFLKSTCCFSDGYDFNNDYWKKATKEAEEIKCECDGYTLFNFGCKCSAKKNTQEEKYTRMVIK